MEFSNEVFVGNLKYLTSQQDLEDVCSAVGTVLNVKIPTDPDTGRGKGYGFVAMSSPADQQRLIEHLDGYELDGRTLSARMCEPRNSRSRPHSNPQSDRARGGRRRRGDDEW